jgi:hypothetical protein
MDVKTVEKWKSLYGANRIFYRSFRMMLFGFFYVDDKEELPEDQKTKIDLGDGQIKKVKTIGDRWSLFQQVNFNNNSQPHYVLITPDGKVSTLLFQDICRKRFQKIPGMRIKFL